MNPLALLPLPVQLLLPGADIAKSYLAIPAAAAILWLSHSNPRQLLRQLVYERFGDSVTVYVGQSITDHVLLRLRRESWSHATIECLMGQLPGTALIYLPSEGTSSFSFQGKSLQVKRKDVHKQTESLTIIGPTQEAVQGFMDHCKKEGESSRGIRYWTTSPQASWAEGSPTWVTSGPDRAPRTLDSVTLPAGMKEQIRTNISLFDSEKQRRLDAALGDVHCSTYVFYGPPGTGKNSCAEAISSLLHWDVYVFHCGDPSLTDGHFAYLLSKIDPPCVVLFDELDGALKRIHRLQTAGAFQGGVSDGILNGYLNGGISLNNVVTILLANDLAEFSDALLREERVDHVFQLTRATKAMARKLLISCFTPKYDLDEQLAQEWGNIQVHADAFADRIVDGEYTPATITSYLKKLSDPRRAVREMDRMKAAKVP